MHHWEVIVLGFFLFVTSSAIVGYGYYNYQENKRLATQARAIANAPIPTITPTPTPESVRIQGNNPYEVLKNALTSHHYRVSAYGSLPIQYPLSSLDASRAAHLSLPTGVDYRNATTFYSISNVILRVQSVTDTAERALVVRNASQSAFFISDKDKTAIAVPYSEPYWNTIRSYLSYASPLWILSQVQSWNQVSDDTWHGTIQAYTITLTHNKSTNLPERLELFNGEDSVGVVTLDMKQIDDDITFTAFPARYHMISLKEATESATKR
jgi:hypothetical protein